MTKTSLIGMCVVLTAATGAFAITEVPADAGMTYQQIRAMDDNVSAVEFSIMDTDHDGLVTTSDMDSQKEKVLHVPVVKKPIELFDEKKSKSKK